MKALSSFSYKRWKFGNFMYGGEFRKGDMKLAGLWKIGWRRAEGVPGISHLHPINHRLLSKAGWKIISILVQTILLYPTTFVFSHYHHITPSSLSINVRWLETSQTLTLSTSPQLFHAHKSISECKYVSVHNESNDRVVKGTNRECRTHLNH